MNFDQALSLAKLGLKDAPDLNEEVGIEREGEELVIAAYRKATGRGRTFSRNDLYMRAMESFPEKALSILKQYLERRVGGEPLAYIVGYRFFLNHEYFINKNVLVPRFETEILVFEAYQWLRRRGLGQSRGLEIGLGSGIVSLELLKLIPDLKMHATEASSEAIECAMKNRSMLLGESEQDRLHLEKVEPLPAPLVSSDFERKLGLVDFIISNPPYLANESEAMRNVIEFEPSLALFPKTGEPNIFYTEILKLAARVLQPKGFVFLELPHERASKIESLFSGTFKTHLVNDLTGRPRVLVAELNGYEGDRNVH